jgi:hypothetical protein
VLRKVGMTPGLKDANLKSTHYPLRTLGSTTEELVQPASGKECRARSFTAGFALPSKLTLR